MRHKFLIALAGLLEEQGFYLDDVSELDETFVLDSYKGKALPDSVCRKPRRHGAKAEKRGLSNEYVCICTGAQRKGCVIAETLNRAKPSSQELQSVFGGHISEGILVLCDGLRSYQSLEETAGCTVKDVNSESGTAFYNLNTVNAFHSFIKKRYEFYRGVATKYLNRYNALFSAAYKCTTGDVKTAELLLIKSDRGLSPHFLTNLIFLMSTGKYGTFA